MSAATPREPDPKVDAVLALTPEQRRIVSDILRAEIPDRAVWAFGSRATGQARRASDLDLAILGDPPLSLSQLGALREAFSDSNLPMRVDLVDLTELSASLRDHCVRTHVVMQYGRGDPPPFVSKDEKTDP